MQTICRVLVDFDDHGVFYLLTIATEDEARLFDTLRAYSHDVRFVERQETLSRRDTGKRRLPDGSRIVRCQYFGSKCAEKKAGKFYGMLEKAVKI